MAIIEDDETLNAFVEESLEHLDGIESDLLEIEEGGADINDDLVNKVFRAVHSIKGGAGFLGLANVKELGHGMENLLNMVRERTLIPTPQIISILLDSADILTNMIYSPQTSNDQDISPQLDALRKALSSALGEEDKATLDTTVILTHPEQRTVFEICEFDIRGSLKEGFNLFILEYDLIKDIEQKGKTPLDVIKELQKTGEIHDSKIDLDSVGGLDQDFGNLTVPFYVLFGSMLEMDLLMTFTNLEPEQIYFIDPENLDYTSAREPEEAKVEEEPPVESPAVQSSPPPAATEKVIKPAPAPPKPKSSSKEPAASAKKTNSAPKSSKSTGTESSIRVNVKILDNLMTLAGELVLTRNQLLQSVSSGNIQGVETVSQRLDLVTSELQEAIMSTRMQPVGNVFNKFKRVVRDMSKQLGKEINLTIEGKEVELDKTIIEAIGDPLTHLVRNSVDHGLEMPDVRTNNKKSAQGKLRLSAFHEGGHVIIEIEDDGAGIDTQKIQAKVLEMGLYDQAQLASMPQRELNKLIFTPGLSTAKAVTDISGRGVGMDVVNTNLSRVGGVIDVTSSIGEGTIISIKLPLTLAIIPSLNVSVEDERYAIPQVNMVELVRVSAAQVKERVEKIGSAMVMRLRGKLLPLIKLSDVLEMDNTTYRGRNGELQYPDRRKRIEDRRTTVKSEQGASKDIEKTEESSTDVENSKSSRSVADRRQSPSSAYNILVVSANDFHYGLIVDQLLDSEEIVVKPLGSHLRDCKAFAGATIQGDGLVALILDVVGISSLMNLSTVAEQAQKHTDNHDQANRQDAQSLLIVNNTDKEQLAIPLGLVSRIEKIKTSQIEFTGGRANMQYLGGTLPLFGIDEVANISPRDESRSTCYVIVFPFGGREIGIMVNQIVDIIDVNSTIDEVTHKQPGIIGSTIINDKITLLVDLYGVVSTLMPEWSTITNQQETDFEEKEAANILIVEDSRFFLNQICEFIEESGYNTLRAEDGIEALKVLEKEDVDIVLTDIEMPNMDGLELTERIRQDDRISHLPVIAVTSVAGEAAEKKGLQSGVNEYLIKLDREQIIDKVRHYLK
jgi:two-component system, chemotaxis family, sensor kinase CheA